MLGIAPESPASGARFVSPRSLVKSLSDNHIRLRASMPFRIVEGKWGTIACLLARRVQIMENYLHPANMYRIELPYAL